MRFGIGDDVVDVSAPDSFWRVHVPNRINVRALEDGSRQIVGLGNRGQQAEVPGETTVQLAFDVTRFDPDVATAWTRYWIHEAVRGVSRRSAVPASFTAVCLELVWPDWKRIDAEARRAYLLSTARFADVRVNGRLAASSSRLARFLGRPPSIREDEPSSHSRTSVE